MAVYGIDDGKCRVDITEITELVRQLRIRVKNLESAVYTFPYPDANGDGAANSVDASIITAFASQVGSGVYTNDRAGWEQFAAENGYSPDMYPDANGDGVVNAVDASIVSDFAAKAGTVLYTDDAAGFERYMHDR